MKTALLTLALAVVVAAPAAAQSTIGRAQTSASAVKVKNEVSASLASSVKISADSALSIARTAADSGEVSSAELKMDDKHLVYQVKLLNKSKRASEVDVDAMTGAVIRNTQFGGLKSTVVHNRENKKLLNAKRDSAKTSP
ncbi:MAG: hypothetical protein JWL61_4743 [Gemmatimonadetes bacterium]|nr:hypothetical protein [Gemmatimonadota bacterium]